MKNQPILKHPQAFCRIFFFPLRLQMPSADVVDRPETSDLQKVTRLLNKNQGPWPSRCFGCFSVLISLILKVAISGRFSPNFWKHWHFRLKFPAPLRLRCCYHLDDYLLVEHHETGGFGNKARTEPKKRSYWRWLHLPSVDIVFGYLAVSGQSNRHGKP